MFKYIIRQKGSQSHAALPVTRNQSIAVLEVLELVEAEAFSR